VKEKREPTYSSEQKGGDSKGKDKGIRRTKTETDEKELLDVFCSNAAQDWGRGGVYRKTKLLGVGGLAISSVFSREL